MSDSVDRLYEAVLAAKHADPATSRTSRLMHAGRAKMGKKLGEEAFEVVISALHANPEAVVRESADLLYNLVVLWASVGVAPVDVWKEMNRRERLFGIAEKMLKSRNAKVRAPLATVAMRPAHKRRVKVGQS